MTQSTSTIQTTSDTTVRRIETTHEELLLKLDELDKQIAAVLAEWEPSRENDPLAPQVVK